MMGKYGGSAFLIAYLLFTLLIGIPALMSEWSLGRTTRKGPIGTFKRLFGPRLGVLIGALLILTVIVADSYYLVVISNVAFTAIFSFWKGFEGANLELYQSYMAMGSLQYFLAVILLVFSLIVIEQGLNKGIIPVSQVFVPFFILVMAYMIVHVLLIDGTVDYLLAFLKPDLSKLNAEVLFAALGQSFFSLGLGGTFMLVYGSYLKDDQDIPTGAFWTGLGDMGAALMAALFIVPAVLFLNLDLEAGPRLIFNVLPEVFTKIPLGGLLGGLFLLGLTLVAFLSNLAALEVVVRSADDMGLRRFSRGHVIVGLGMVLAILMIPSAFNSSVIEIIGLTWSVGHATTRMQLGERFPFLTSRKYFFWIKYVVPIALGLILLGYLIS